MKNIIKLAKGLASLRIEIDAIKLQLKPIEEKKAAIQIKLIDEMKKIELKSIKTETHNFARTIKKDVHVYDEQAVINYLDKHGEKDQYVYSKLDTLKFKSYAKSMLKETGEIVDGTEPTESEYISIKANK